MLIEILLSLDILIATSNCILYTTVCVPRIAKKNNSGQNTIIYQEKICIVYYALIVFIDKV